LRKAPGFRAGCRPRLVAISLTGSGYVDSASVFDAEIAFAVF